MHEYTLTLIPLHTLKYITDKYKYNAQKQSVSLCSMSDNGSIKTDKFLNLLWILKKMETYFCDQQLHNYVPSAASLFLVYVHILQPS